MKPLSRDFLLNRGFCCKCGCKNCPYKINEMIKLKDILLEIGDGSSKAFPWQYKESHPASDDQDFTYTFQGDKGQGIVTFVFGDHNEWDVAFGSLQPRSPIDSTEEGDFSTLTDEGPFRVMATVTEIIKDFLSNTYKKHIDDKGLFGKTEPKELSFNTTKEPGRGKKGTSKRAKLYQAYIQKQLPGASVRKFIAGNNTDGYIITLP